MNLANCQLPKNLGVRLLIKVKRWMFFPIRNIIRTTGNLFVYFRYSILKFPVGSCYFIYRSSRPGITPAMLAEKNLSYNAYQPPFAEIIAG